MKVYNPHTVWRVIEERIVHRNYGSLYLSELFLKKLPHFLSRIDRISGDFYVQNNKLTSLENCPKHVSGHFVCTRNRLTSLHGCSRVNATCIFNCAHNMLTTLEGGPKSVNEYYCHNNLLRDLKGGPMRVKRYFNFRNNLIKNIPPFNAATGEPLGVQFNVIRTNWEAVPTAGSGWGY